MRIEFVKGSLYIAKKTCPWACKIVKVIDGYKCFESWEDLKIWKNQK